MWAKVLAIIYLLGAVGTVCSAGTDVDTLVVGLAAIVTIVVGAALAIMALVRKE
jgi:hypothetical protein